MNKIYIAILCLAMTATLSSCFDDLDQLPQSEDSFTELDVYSNATEAKSALAKLYASLAITGQEGPAGHPDISGLDEGTTGFSRLLILMQDVPTDVTINGWADAGMPSLNFISWGADNAFNEGMYYRLGQTVSFCNSFIENAEALSDDPDVAYFIAEARFIRAYVYYYLMDFYGSTPLETVVSDQLPEQKTREELFNFVESELLDVQDLLMADGANEYGRVDQVAAWAMLSRLYLNAEVYTGTPRYDDCITYSNLVINSSYALSSIDTNGSGSAYDELFCADNNENGAQTELIFTANYDGLNTTSYGGTTFLVCGNYLDGMSSGRLGTTQKWNGNKMREDFVNKFSSSVTNYQDGDPIAWSDARALFSGADEGRTVSITGDIAQDEQGYGSYKYTNVYATTGEAGSNDAFMDTDLPLIRLAEIYLNYAEAVYRGGSGGSTTTADDMVNALRTRANASTASSIDLDFILDERARELYMEGFRRTDLIRYGYFTSGSYVWSYKGGTESGSAVNSKYRLYPLPTSILNANENLAQNPGY